MVKSRAVIPDYKPTTPERLYQQDESERFLAESRARFDTEKKEAHKRRRRVAEY
jgi:hypothetical protein